MSKNYEDSKSISADSPREFCQDATIEQSLLLKPAPDSTRASIGCKEARDSPPTIDVMKDLTIGNLDVTNININLTNSLTLTLVGCQMTNTTISYQGTEQINLQIVNTTFRGDTNSSCIDETVCESSSSIKVTSLRISILYWNSIFLQTTQILNGLPSDKVKFVQSIFN